MPKDIKKLLLKADKLQMGKEMALAEEFIDIEENIQGSRDSIEEKLDSTMEAILVKLAEEKEQEKVTVSKMDNLPKELNSVVGGFSTVFIKGEKGEKGDIGPRGPKGDKGDKGDDGKDYTLTNTDKKEIASMVKVPVVEKVTEIIKEPIYTENIIEKALYESAEDIVSKINELPIDEDKQIDASHIKNLPEVVNRVGFGSMLKEAPKDGLVYGRQNRAWVEVVSGAGAWGTITGTLSDQTDLQTELNSKENTSNKATDFSTVNDTLYPTVQAAKTYADNLVAGLLDYRGAYDASSNVFPSTGGSGTAGAIMKGDMFIISVAGTLGGTAVQVGDSLIASVDTPAQTASNWNILNSNITYVPEDVANKDTDVTLSLNSDTKYPTQKAVKTYVDLRELSSNKSTATTLGASDILYPTQKAVKTYIDNSVSTETENAQSGTSYTFALTDGGKMVTGSNSSPTTFTVPTNSSIGFPIGTRIDVLQIGTGKITIANSVGVILLSQGGNKTIKEQYVACTLWKKDTDLWYLMGNLQA